MNDLRDELAYLNETLYVKRIDKSTTTSLNF